MVTILMKIKNLIAVFVHLDNDGENRIIMTNKTYRLKNYTKMKGF